MSVIENFLRVRKSWADSKQSVHGLLDDAESASLITNEECDISKETC